MTNDHPITPIDSRRAWDCLWYGVRQDRIRLPDGGEGVYNVLEHPDAVWIVPVMSAGEIVLIRNYRYPLRQWVWELPSGSIAAGESPLEAARRELREEAGSTAGEWRLLIQASLMNGIGTEYANLFLATGVTLGAPDHEPAEIMTVHTFPAAEALRMARAGEINDVVSSLALLLAESEMPHG
jgi:8-oxo-dGTP pyrophosphatase MutT (NUDIX family)